MDESLRKAAREGNVSDLYALIQEDGNVLKRIDEVEFIDTPLHIAADAGSIDFAKEVMSLMPSFARKLNQHGLSPIHLALEKGHKELVLYLLENAKDLVRVKGKKGETPLHYVITREENRGMPFLSRFLEDCPESIRDLTVENQTALHIAVRNNKEEALKILCKMLRKTNYCQDVVNHKDRNGDTALHIAAHDNRHEMIKQLLNCKANKHATNQAGSTALDLATQLNNRESIRSLHIFPIVSTVTYKLQKLIFKYVTKASAVIFQDMDNISMDDRNALLVILGLLLTATYQASLSPPGSVWQGDGSSNSIVTAGKVPGTSVMNQSDFLLFYIPASAVFVVTFFLTLGLLKPFPNGFRTALQALLAFLAICFYDSIFFIAPTYSASLVINLFSVLVFVLMVFMCVAYRVSKVSVLILGCWLLPAGAVFQGHITGYFVVGFVLFLFLYDEFWKGIAMVVGYYLLINLAYQSWMIESIYVIGGWLCLSLCRFILKWFPCV